MKPYKTFLARLGLGSARGRYLYIAGLFSLFLLIISWLEQSWLVALIGLSVVVLGFFVFEYTIRLPIVRTTKALKAEMQSSKGAALPKTNIVESTIYSKSLTRCVGKCICDYSTWKCCSM